MLKKINYIFRLEGIFDSLNLQFDTFRATSDGGGIESKRVQISGTCENSTFLMVCS